MSQGSYDADVAIVGVEELDGALAEWLDVNGRGAVVSRPDAYVFGSCADAPGAAALIDALRTNIPAAPVASASA